MRLLLLMLFSLAARAEYVSPDTPSKPVPPPEAPKLPAAPPECVTKILEAIFEAEKKLFAEKKLYSDSLFELKVASKVGLGCSGWELPEIKLSYGGAGFNLSMTEQATKYRWILTQEHALSLDASDAKPLKPAVKEEAPKK